MKTLVFDTETTGIPIHPRARLSAQPRILEFGGALVDEDGHVIDEINLLINPITIPSNLPKRSNLIDKDKIFRITGIDTDILKDYPTFRGVADQIRPFFEAADQLVAHNLPFDKTMMGLEIKRAEITDWPWPPVQICTVQEHVEEFGRFSKLLELYEHYTGEPLNQTHRALDDVYALVEVCKGSGILK